MHRKPPITPQPFPQGTWKKKEKGKEKCFMAASIPHRTAGLDNQPAIGLFAKHKKRMPRKTSSYVVEDRCSSHIRDYSFFQFFPILSLSKRETIPSMSVRPLQSQTYSHIFSDLSTSFTFTLTQRSLILLVYVTRLFGSIIRTSTHIFLYLKFFCFTL